MRCKGGVAKSYSYKSTDIKALVVLPGDWHNGDVDRFLHILLDKIQ